MEFKPKTLFYWEVAGKSLHSWEAFRIKMKIYFMQRHAVWPKPLNGCSGVRTSLLVCDYMGFRDLILCLLHFSATPTIPLPILFSVSLVRDCRGVGVNALRMHPCMRRHLVQLPLDIPPPSVESWRAPLLLLLPPPAGQDFQPDPDPELAYNLCAKYGTAHLLLYVTWLFSVASFAFALYHSHFLTLLLFRCLWPTCQVRDKIKSLCMLHFQSWTQTVIKCSQVRCRRWETRINRKPKSAHSIWF